jgi:hypothetical protein
MSEEDEMLEQRNEALAQALREVDYLISYGKVCEARELIKNTVGEPVNG